jgi:hypothetical protein
MFIKSNSTQKRWRNRQRGRETCPGSKEDTMNTQLQRQTNGVEWMADCAPNRARHSHRYRIWPFGGRFLVSVDAGRSLGFSATLKGASRPMAFWRYSAIL